MVGGCNCNSQVFDECIFEMHSLIFPAFCRFRESDSNHLVRVVVCCYL